MAKANDKCISACSSMTLTLEEPSLHIDIAPPTPTTPFTYCQLNVCTLADSKDPHRREPGWYEVRLTQYCVMFGSCDADFICLQETRIAGSTTLKSFTGYDCFFSGHKTEKKNGVGILVKSKIAKGVEFIHAVGERILIVAGNFRGTHQC